MGDGLEFLLRDEDTILSLALAFALEFSKPELPKPRLSIETKPPVEYFARQDSEMSDAYQPQCDQIITHLDEDIILHDELAMERSIPFEDTRVDKYIRGFEVTKTVQRTEPYPQRKTKARFIPQPVRYSSRCLFKRLEKQEAEKNKIPKTKPIPKADTKQKKPPKPKRKRDKDETPKQRKAREREARAIAAENRKQRKLIENATKSTLRAFGVVASANSKTGMDNINAWRNWHEVTVKMLKKINHSPTSDTFRGSHFLIYVSNSVTALENTMLAARPRPNETHDLMLRFIVDFNNIWEIAFKFGVSQVMGDVGRLVEKVIGKYLSNQKLMNPTHLPWIQTKQLFERLLSLINRTDLIYDLLILLSKMMQIFLGKWTHRVHEFKEFKAYAVSQLTGFCTILSQRMSRLAIPNNQNI